MAHIQKNKSSSKQNTRKLFSPSCLHLCCLAAILAGAFSALTFTLPALAQDYSDPVVFALSSRHMTASLEQLEEQAGGQDALVAKLLELRTSEKPPWAGIRAQKLLLNYADREDVQEALEEDIQSEQYKGLARTIAIHLDKVKDPRARRSLARLAVKRGTEEAEFEPYARRLSKSSDPEVKRLAKETFGE